MRLDVFYDIHCSASRAYQRNFKRFLTADYKEGVPFTDVISVVFHYFPLPYHRFAFRSSLLVPYIDDKHGDKATVDYANWMLEK